MSVCFSVRGIDEAQKEINNISDDFKKVAKKVHATFESVRQKQFDEIKVCNAQTAQINNELSQAQQAIEYNIQVKNAAQNKVSQLESLLITYQSQLEATRASLSSLQSKLSSMSPPVRTGDADADRSAQQDYEARRAALQSAISSMQQRIAELQRRIEETKAEILRLKAIIARVGKNNEQLSKLKGNLNYEKRVVAEHLAKLKETKSKLYEKHDSFNTFYGYAQNAMGNAHARAEKAFFNAKMVVDTLSRLGIYNDNVEMEEETLQEAVAVLEKYIRNMEEEVEDLMRSKNVFRSRLKDKISERVKYDLEKIDNAAREIDSNLQYVAKILNEANFFLKDYCFLGR